MANLAHDFLLAQQARANLLQTQAQTRLAQAQAGARQQEIADAQQAAARTQAMQEFTRRLQGAQQPGAVPPGAVPPGAAPMQPGTAPMQPGTAPTGQIIPARPQGMLPDGLTGQIAPTIRNQAAEDRAAADRMQTIGEMFMQMGDFKSGREYVKDAMQAKYRANQAEHENLVARRDEAKAMADLMGTVKDQASMDNALQLADMAGYDTRGIVAITGGQYTPHTRAAVAQIAAQAMTQKERLDLDLRTQDQARANKSTDDLLRHRRVMEGFSQQSVAISREGLKLRKTGKAAWKGKGIAGTATTESELREMYKILTEPAKEDATTAMLRERGMLPAEIETPSKKLAKTLRQKGFSQFRREQVEHLKATGEPLDYDTAAAVAEDAGAVLPTSKEFDDQRPAPKTKSLLDRYKEWVGVAPPAPPTGTVELPTDVPGTPELPTPKVSEAQLQKTMKKWGYTREQVLAELARRAKQAASREGAK